jgi:hypothetical protein
MSAAVTGAGRLTKNSYLCPQLDELTGGCAHDFPV